jgi:rhodanese-related sulfurtransferase
MTFNRMVLAVSIGLLIVIASANVQARGPIDDSDKHGIAAKDLKARLNGNQKTIIIDARGHLDGQMIKGAAHVPTSKLEEWAKSADKSAFIVTYCTCPHDEAAEEAVKALRGMGFANTFSLSGGLSAAQAAGIPVVPVSE